MIKIESPSTSHAGSSGSLSEVCIFSPEIKGPEGSGAHASSWDPGYLGGKKKTIKNAHVTFFNTTREKRARV